MASSLDYNLKKKDDRAFENPFHEKTKHGELVESDVIDIERKEIYPHVSEKLSKSVERLLSQWEDQIRRTTTNDYSVYTGLTGYSLLYWHLSNIYKKGNYLQIGYELLEDCVSSLKGHRHAFLTGDGGPLALAAVFAHKLNNFEKRDDCVQRIHKLYKSRKVLSQESDELLYGKVGCLYSLLFLQKHLGNEFVERDLIISLTRSIINSGKSFAAEETRKGYRTPPLFYQWHEKVYFAAAHGMAGIFFILFQAKEFLDEEILNSLIRPSLDYLLEFQFSNGNFPSSSTNSTDRLVQWCHGAPGFVHCLTAAAEIYKSDMYLKAAEKCADVIWQRGLLQKGYGLCHGVSGNAYAFLNLFQATKFLEQIQMVSPFPSFELKTAVSSSSCEIRRILLRLRQTRLQDRRSAIVAF